MRDFLVDTLWCNQEYDTLPTFWANFFVVLLFLVEPLGNLSEGEVKSYEHSLKDFWEKNTATKTLQDVKVSILTRADCDELRF